MARMGLEGSIGTILEPGSGISSGMPLYADPQSLAVYRSLQEWLDAFRSELVAEVRRGRRPGADL